MKDRRRLRGRARTRPRPARGRVRGEDPGDSDPPASHRPSGPARSLAARLLARRPAHLARLMGVLGDFVPPARAPRAGIPRRAPCRCPRSAWCGRRGFVKLGPSWIRASRLVALAGNGRCSLAGRGRALDRRRGASRSRRPALARATGRARPPRRPSGSRRRWTWTGRPPRSPGSSSRRRGSGATRRTTTILGTASSTTCSTAGSASRSRSPSCTWPSRPGPGSTPPAWGCRATSSCGPSGGGRHRLLDPFHGGTLLDRAACEALVARVRPGGGPLDPRWLAPVTTRQIFVRMLSNLKAVYTALGDWARALAAVGAHPAPRPGRAGGDPRPGHAPRTSRPGQRRPCATGRRTSGATARGRPRRRQVVAEDRPAARPLRQALGSSGTERGTIALEVGSPELHAERR